MNYIIDNNKLNFENNWSLRFRSPIKKFIDFENVLIILLEREINTGFIQNVYAINKKTGEQQWQIDRLEEIEYQNEVFIGIEKPYVDIVKIAANKVRLINWDGTRLDVNTDTGILLINVIEARKGKKPW